MSDNSLFGVLNKDNYYKYYNENMQTVFASIPNNMFYLRGDISAFILNPYMNFDYNLLNSCPKHTVRIANNNLIKKSDQVWFFSDNFYGLTDGVISEIYLAKEFGKKLKFFELPFFKEKEINIKDIPFETIKDYYGIKLKDVNWNTCYTAMSSKLFYYKTHISKFVLENSIIPLNPFTSFDYFLVDLVDRKHILEANFKLVSLSDELWTFDKISDGVQAEILMAKEKEKKVRNFKLIDKKEIKEINENELEFE